MYLCKYMSPIGEMVLKSDGRALVGAWFIGQSYFPADLDVCSYKQLELFDKVTAYLDKYFAGEKAEIDFELAPNGSEFRQLVWSEVMKIPYGTTKTYKEITVIIEKNLGRRMSAQAVGSAIAHNPIIIIIPCHRVVGTNGNLTGYAGGIDKKKYLINLEKALD